MGDEGVEAHGGGGQPHAVQPSKNVWEAAKEPHARKHAGWAEGGVEIGPEFGREALGLDKDVRVEEEGACIEEHTHGIEAQLLY